MTTNPSGHADGDAGSSVPEATRAAKWHAEAWAIGIRADARVTPMHLASDRIADRLMALADAEVAAAVAEERATTGRRMTAVEALFAGGPDTACRTTWREDGSRPDCSAAAIECVEVPMSDLRAALVSPGEGE